ALQPPAAQAAARSVSRLAATGGRVDDDADAALHLPRRRTGRAAVPGRRLGRPVRADDRATGRAAQVRDGRGVDPVRPAAALPQDGLRLSEPDDELRSPDQPPGDDLRSEETRLNSSHSQISYAVFCLKKK